MPADVCIPDGFTDIAVEYFDDYSWRAFVALVWPAAPEHRGVAASAKGIASGGPRVFETYKALWEIFHGDGSAPEAAFDGYDAASEQPVRRVGDVRRRDHRIGVGDRRHRTGRRSACSIPPLVAQNGRYVRTLTLFNQIEFDHIVRNRFFLRSALPPVPRPRPDRPVIDFPMGSIAVKTAWVDVTGLPAAAGQAVLHADGAREARDRRRLCADDGRTDRPAHRAEDAEPAAVDLVVVRAEGHGAAGVAGLARARSC